MKTLAALTLTAVVSLSSAPAQANPITDAMQQLAASQLAEIKVTVVQQARQAMDKTATELRQFMQAEQQVAQSVPQVSKQSEEGTANDTKPAAE